MKYLWILLLLIPTATLGQTACPLDEYERWDKYETNKQEMPIAINAGKAMGYMKAFAYVEEDVALWWTFAVDPGVPLASVSLTTDKGTYDSDLVMFTTYRQTELVFCPAVADPDYESIKVKGKQRVVAFARFPSEPKGKLVSWTTN